MTVPPSPCSIEEQEQSSDSDDRDIHSHGVDLEQARNQMVDAEADGVYHPAWKFRHQGGSEPGDRATAASARCGRFGMIGVGDGYAHAGLASSGVAESRDMNSNTRDRSRAFEDDGFRTDPASRSLPASAVAPPLSHRVSHPSLHGSSSGRIVKSNTGRAVYPHGLPSPPESPSDQGDFDLYQQLRSRFFGRGYVVDEQPPNEPDWSQALAHPSASNVNFDHHIGRQLSRKPSEGTVSSSDFSMSSLTHSTSLMSLRGDVEDDHDANSVLGDSHASKKSALESLWGDRRLGTNGAPVAFRPGDWICLARGCSYHNFTNKEQCAHCGAHRPDEHQPLPTSPTSSSLDWLASVSRPGLEYSASLPTVSGNEEARSGRGFGDSVDERFMVPPTFSPNHDSKSLETALGPRVSRETPTGRAIASPSSRSAQVSNRSSHHHSNFLGGSNYQKHLQGHIELKPSSVPTPLHPALSSKSHSVPDFSILSSVSAALWSSPCPTDRAEDPAAPPSLPWHEPSPTPYSLTSVPSGAPGFRGPDHTAPNRPQVPRMQAPIPSGLPNFHQGYTLPSSMPGQAEVVRAIQLAQVLPRRLPLPGQVAPDMPDDVKLAPIINTGNIGPMVVQQGDWTCLVCGYINWKRRSICQRCFPYASGNDMGAAIAKNSKRAAELAGALALEQSRSAAAASRDRRQVQGPTQYQNQRIPIIAPRFNTLDGPFADNNQHFQPPLSPSHLSSSYLQASTAFASDHHRFASFPSQDISQGLLRPQVESPASAGYDLLNAHALEALNTQGRPRAKTVPTALHGMVNAVNPQEVHNRPQLGRRQESVDQIRERSFTPVNAALDRYHGASPEQQEMHLRRIWNDDHLTAPTSSASSTRSSILSLCGPLTPGAFPQDSRRGSSTTDSSLHGSEILALGLKNSDGKPLQRAPRLYVDGAKGEALGSE